jgi:hypothetical protein
MEEFLETFSGLMLKTIQSIDVALIQCDETSVMKNHTSYFMHQFKKIIEHRETAVIMKALKWHTNTDFKNHHYNELIYHVYAWLAESNRIQQDQIPQRFKYYWYY